MTNAQLLRNGQIIDPQSGTISHGDVVLAGGRVLSVAAPPPEGLTLEVLDLDGAYLCPGLVDLHTHVFHHPLFRQSRVEADRIGVRQGVACVADAGSSGTATIDAFPHFVHESQATEVFAFINIGSPGLPGIAGGHASRPELLDLPGVVGALTRYPDWLVGVKVLASASHTGAFGLEAVKMARKAAELAGKPLMVHIGNAPPIVDDVLDLLRPGDIVTHTYHGKAGGVLTHGERILPAFRAAVERGVIVDLGHGSSSFSFRVARTALDAGMPVHAISSDLHRGSLDRSAVSLARTMSKMMALGMPLMDVIAAASLTPARAIGIDRFGFGSLAADGPAHLTSFVLEPCEREVEDAEGESLRLERWLRPRHVWVSGRRFEVNAPL